MPLDKTVEQPRLPRFVQKPIEGQPGKTEYVLETPKEPLGWPVHVFYLKPIVVLLNIVPMLVMLVLYARLLDRVAESDWAWMLSLAAGAFGTYLFVFAQHSIITALPRRARFSRFTRGEDLVGRARSASTFAAAGFWGAHRVQRITGRHLRIAAVLPPFRPLSGEDSRRSCLGLVPIVAFLATQFLAFGQFKPVYEEFGTKSYNYEGSYWNTPLEFDWFNASTTLPDGTKVPNQEPYAVYLMHMTIGHHGVFSMSPIFAFSLLGGLRILIVRRGRLAAVGWLTWILTVAMLAFYTWNPKARITAARPKDCVGCSG